jgi:hypothetical protein
LRGQHNAGTNNVFDDMLIKLLPLFVIALWPAYFAWQRRYLLDSSDLLVSAAIALPSIAVSIWAYRVFAGGGYAGLLAMAFLVVAGVAAAMSTVYFLAVLAIKAIAGSD